MGTTHTCGPSPWKVSQQESPKYFSHKIKFQDIQARNRSAFLTARVALHSFSTTENYLENHLHKVCKCCQSDRRKPARPQGPRPPPSALHQPWLCRSPSQHHCPGAVNMPLAAQAGSRGEVRVRRSHQLSACRPIGPRPELWELR